MRCRMRRRRPPRPQHRLCLWCGFQGRWKKVGVIFKTSTKASEQWQRDLKGNEYHLPSNWG
eukprot:6130143-Lingulodinium_polyedra.AAC.1